MQVIERSAAEAAQLIAAALEQAGLPYAIGDALALAVAGVPRGTADVDVNLFVSGDRIGEAIATFAGLGMNLDVDDVKVQARDRGMFIARWNGMRIDVILPSIPFSGEAERTRVRMTDASGWSGWFLSAEALSVFKLLFFRGKDMVDLERLVAVRHELDHAYVRRAIVDMMGDDDPRITRWDDIVSRFAPSAGDA